MSFGRWPCTVFEELWCRRRFPRKPSVNDSDLKSNNLLLNLLGRAGDRTEVLPPSSIRATSFNASRTLPGR